MVDLRRIAQSTASRTAALPRLGRRHPGRAAAAVAVVLGLLLWWLAPGGGPAPSGTVSFATGVPTGVYARYGSLLKDRVHRDIPDVRLKLLESQGSVENLSLVSSGKASFTIAASDAVATYRDRKQPGWERLRACARLYDDYIQLVVRAGAPVHSAKDLKGMRVGVGQERSGVNLIAGRLLQAAGLDPGKDVHAVHQGIDRMPDLLERGRIDAFFWSGGLPTAAIENLSARTNIQLVQLGDLVEKLHALRPETRHYRAAVMPADAYPAVQQGEPVDTVAVANLLVTTDRTGTALTEGMTRAVLNSRDQIGAKVHAAQKVDRRTAIYTSPLKLHQGAQHYYRSVKP